MSIFATFQKALPQHGVSRLAGRLAASTSPLVKNTLINLFVHAYDVNMAEAQISDARQYASFNDFFTRALKPGARPVSDDPLELASPADGTVSQVGRIEGGTLLQAKGHDYSIRSLAGELGDGFEGGAFATIYLAPRNYHRVHIPCAARLTSTLAIPGALYSVNAHTEQSIDGLFTRNERLVCRFSTAFGPMLLVMVGALIVGSIGTVWDQAPTPYQETIRSEFDVQFRKGDEIGRFLLGSTVICCFPPDAVVLESALQQGSAIEVGRVLGLVNL